MLMRIVTNIHSLWGVAIMTLSSECGCVVVAAVSRSGLRLVVAVFGGMLLNFLLKHLFLRPRPDLRKSAPDAFHDLQFPSSHTMATTVFYGTLCAFVISRVRGSFRLAGTRNSRFAPNDCARGLQSHLPGRALPERCTGSDRRRVGNARLLICSGGFSAAPAKPETWPQVTDDAGRRGVIRWRPICALTSYS